MLLLKSKQEGGKYDQLKVKAKLKLETTTNCI